MDRHSVSSHCLLLTTVTPVLGAFCRFNNLLFNHLLPESAPAYHWLSSFLSPWKIPDTSHVSSHSGLRSGTLRLYGAYYVSILRNVGPGDRALEHVYFSTTTATRPHTTYRPSGIFLTYRLIGSEQVDLLDGTISLTCPAVVGRTRPFSSVLVVICVLMFK
ncbi:hypothetical protein ASPWEDRAFT_39868 [Aspergillus wentii DTO 134E9]|uniref:Uncharacterized protein n=1 Tax=Aspergillus wentii DTO 134E9 TaxID=1073089 RepID=A0A1L9RIN8_ASPWE|nr:uncharacterized protein ASPWEDRAFT_39868 [Aspergillus wentii DTO 134E9]OJJ34785.1 hypothetical protein ASPWEDRAFT_39868 [Aspergillus wentii DTO 134E9]